MGPFSNGLILGALLVVGIALVNAGPLRGPSHLRLGSIVVTPEKNFSKCINVDVLGECCIELYVIESNLTIGVILIIHNHTVINKALDGDEICVGDDTLLDLIKLICPPCAPVIKIIEDALGFVPFDVLNVCLEFEDLKFNAHNVTGDAVLDSTILCWKDHCVYQGTDNFGNFTLRY